MVVLASMNPMSTPSSTHSGIWLNGTPFQLRLKYDSLAVNLISRQEPIKGATRRNILKRNQGYSVSNMRAN